MTELDYTPGRALGDYPRPSLAVDIAAFTYSRDFRELKVLVIRGDDGEFRLPGAFVRHEERLSDAVLRTMATKAGIKPKSPILLDVFDEPGRDPRGWVVTVAHLLVVPEEDVTAPSNRDARWIGVDPLPRLIGDHAAILGVALEKLRREYEIDQRLVKENFSPATETSIPRNVYAGKPDPEGFFSKPFTLRELQALHETVAGRQFLSPKSQMPSQSSELKWDSMSYRKPTSASGTLRDTFRRLMEPQLREVGTNESSLSTRGAPSRTWLVHN